MLYTRNFSFYTGVKWMSHLLLKQYKGTQKTHKKIVNQSLDFLVRRTGLYRHKKSTAAILLQN